MLWFLACVGALVAASCEVENSTCDGGVTLLQSSARGVRVAPRPKPEHVEWQWGKSGGFVKWRGHHITVALDASMYRPVLSQDPAPTLGSAVLRALCSVFVIGVISCILVPPMLIFLVLAGGVVSAAQWVLPKRKSKASKATRVTDEDMDVPALWPPPSKSSWPFGVTCACVVDVLLNSVLVLLFATGKLQTTREILPGLMVETLASFILFAFFARWEDQRHIITAWQAVQAVRFFLVRRAIYASLGTFVASLLLLLAVSSVGVKAELAIDHDVRLPPFEPLKFDLNRPRHGWLGPYAEWVESKYLRWLITGCFFLADQVRLLLFVYLCSDGPENDTAQVSDGTFHQVAASAVIFQCLVYALYNLTCFYATFLRMKTWYEQDPLLQAYRTGPYQVPALAPDQGPDSDLLKQLQSHKCRSITVVIPAYMPNEEDILLDCLEVYREEAAKYPGCLRVMLVWNSPQEHTWIEQKLLELEAEWPALEVHRNHMSTSKCDNLNLAVELLETDFALFNDVDTMVSAESMCRASLRLFRDGHHAVQANLVHCWEDFAGLTDTGFYPYGPLTTCMDALISENEFIYPHLQMPFCHGRGSFWRAEAIKKIAFDHRTVGEDHDAMLRGWAYYGFTGAVDANILCQEREPPDFQNWLSQRTRWFNGQVQKKRALTWLVRSKHISAFPKMLNVYLDWVEKPFQIWAFALFMWMPAFVLKSRPCAFNPLLVTTVMGTTVALPVWFLLLLLVPWATQKAAALLWTRYRPRWLAYIMVSFIAPWAYNAVKETLVRCRMLHDCLWSGQVKFVCTTRDKTPSRSPSVMSPASRMSPEASFYGGLGGPTESG